MYKLTVTYREIAEFEFTQRIAAQHGYGINKSLDAVVKHKKIIYVVKNKKVELLRTPSLVEAVDRFNEL